VPRASRGASTDISPLLPSAAPLVMGDGMIAQPLRSFDVVVVGGGPAGLAAAIALASAGRSTALLALRQPYADNRTTALLGRSVDFLESLGVWWRCAADAAPLSAMRLIDASARLLRSPEIRFDAAELGLPQFGFNIENRVLMRALSQRAAELPGLTWFDAQARMVSPHEKAVAVTLDSGDVIDASLAVGADGRGSICRAAAGLTPRTRSLDQSALTFNVGISRPHQGISTEFHTPEGPCVFVPLSDQRCSVVWVCSPATAARLAESSDDDLAQTAERQSRSVYGKLKVEGGRHLFALAIERLASVAANRIALIGEAAHVLPPIGAQGLNLGLRDAADLAATVSGADVGGDIGAASVLARYAARRSADIGTRTAAIDVANRSLLNDFFPVQAARAVSMQALAAIPTLRRLAMREGLGPFWRR
jgi:2-octaprenyl-6-methoxyphenol hydroxylase